MFKQGVWVGLLVLAACSRSAHPDPTPNPTPNPQLDPTPTPTPTPNPSPSPNPSPNPSPSPSPNPSPNPSPSPKPARVAGPSRPARDAAGRAARRDRTDDDDDDDGEAPRPRRRWPAIVAIGATLAAGVTAIVLAGRANHRHLYLRCGPTQITATRGRSFPPWGTARLDGPRWRPIAIPPATECTDQATADPAELEGWYLGALVEQAGAALGAEGGDVDRAEAQLQQALLLARSPERRDARKDIDRLLADVTYARAARQIQAAIATLRDGATRFDDAAGRRPRHAADAAAWAAFARSIALRLEAGPTGEPRPTLLPPSERDRPPAPMGVALPVEPGVDAGVLAPPEVDAGVPGIPSGGVLM